MRDDLPSGTVAFLFTDVERSTKLLHSLGAETYAEALADHRELIRDACARHDGVQVDIQGDAFFFGVGLHTGTPLLAEEGYVGCGSARRNRCHA